MNQNYDLNSVASAYGPTFNKKCLMGFFHFQFSMSYTFQYRFSNTLLGNYSIYQELRNSPAHQWGNLFCFGNST
jgi:hypothetical protein